MILNLIFCSFTSFAVILFLNYFATSSDISRNRCELKLVADYEFYHIIGHENYANAARYLINLIERVNNIFSTVNWGIDVNGDRLNNLGFTIKEIKIFDRPHNSPPWNFNSNEQSEVNAMDMLRSFSVAEGTNASCLTVLVSAKQFQYGVLGMSNIGVPGERGICAVDHLNGTLLNTAVITVKRKTELMITRVVDLVLAHELGHAWGSLHDDLHDHDCVPQNSREGRFVMWESVNTGHDGNNYRFSPCSVRSIHRVLYAIAHRCFVEEKKALCGNGILEEGEECDGGGTLGMDTEDICCLANCRLKPWARCSPKHSECCSANCSLMRNGTICQPANNDTCRGASRCDGENHKCPDPKPLPDATNCTDEGLCLAGECTSFCQNHNPDLMPCLCEDEKNFCRRCCRSIRTGICSPIQIEPQKWLPENSTCIHGQCHNNVCVKTATDSVSFWPFLGKTPDHRKFFADYMVFIVIAVTLLIWCPCGAVIVYRDRRKLDGVVAKQTAARGAVQIVAQRKRIVGQQNGAIGANGHGQHMDMASLRSGIGGEGILQRIDMASAGKSLLNEDT